MLIRRTHNFFRAIFDPWPSSDERMRDRVYSFTTANFTGGLIAALVLPLYIYFSGMPGPVVWIAFAWLMVPLALAFGPRMGMSLNRAHTISVVNMTGLVTYLMIFTGGLSSFLIAWFVIIPVEASLSRRKQLTALAIALGCLSIGGLYAMDRFGLMPADQMEVANWSFLFTASTLAALIYAGAVAMSVQQLHQRVEADAKSGEDRYKFLTDNALDMIIRHRSDGSIAFISKASKRVLGYTPEEVMEFEPGELINRADRKHVEIALSRASHFGEDVTIEFRMAHKNGDFIWLEMRCRPVAIANRAELMGPAHYLNTLSGANLLAEESHEIIAVARDISRAKEYEQELIHARELAEAGSRSKLHFLANVSHELRTPLSAINGFSDIMSREMFGPMDNKKYLEYSKLIHSSGNHLLELINDLLDMSKIEAGKYSIDHESIFFPVVIESCLRLVRLQMEEAKVRLHVDLPPGLPRLEADPRACKQILLNLLSNAIKFTEPGGDITVSMYMEEGAQVLEVSDTGVGIDPSHLGRLGKPYEQVKGASNFVANDRTQAGTGLGLALVRSLTELHGGEFAISSEVGTGTKVRVSLPLVAPVGHDVDEPLPGIFGNDIAAEIVEASREALEAIAEDASRNESTDEHHEDAA
jgi:cell cycle sensor histidine kinase DivJ